MARERSGIARRNAETGAARKEWGGRRKIAIVYPNAYPLAMSNLGFLLIHAQINARPDRLCERAFLAIGEKSRRPVVCGERRARSGAAPVAGRTLESGRLLSEFDVVAISLSFENDLLNVPGVLAAGGVSPFREDRIASGKRYPLVIAGGFAASLNPEPCGVFADAVVIGDGERAIEALLDLPDGDPADADFMRAVAGVRGVYVASGYAPAYEGEGKCGRLVSLDPLPGFPCRVVRESLDLSLLAPPAPVVLADDAELGSMSLTETSRGCPNKCGFCAASHANPVFREFSLERVRAAVEAARPYRKTAGLIGAAVLDWKPFRKFAREILECGCSVSPASVRADAVDDEIADILAQSGCRTVALAPECGDERLRARVGKHITDDVFFDAAATLVRAGIVSFKLYFLIGLPGTRMEEEAEAIAGFMRRFRERVLAEARAVGRMGAITAVLSPFVPKPFTPLQWAGMAREEELENGEKAAASLIRSVPNLRLTCERPRDAILQGYLGLSDRRAAQMLRMVSGGRLPASPELSAMFSAVVHREKAPDEFFPWDVIEGGDKKANLRARYEKYRMPGDRHSQF